MQSFRHEQQHHRLDLETVPDLRGYAAANDMSASTDDEVREAIGDKFPKHIYHSIVCIGALVAHCDNGAWVVDALGAPHVGDRTEKQLITAFVDRLAERSSRRQQCSMGGSCSGDGSEGGRRLV